MKENITKILKSNIGSDKKRSMRISHSSANIVLNVSFGNSSPTRQFSLARRDSLLKDIQSPALKKNASKFSDPGDLNSEGSYSYSPDKKISAAEKLIQNFKKAIQNKLNSSTELNKPVWGKYIPKEKAEIDEAERIKAKKKFDTKTLLYPVDIEKLPLNVLERKLETKEGKKTYENTNNVIQSMKKYLKQKELIEADNLR